MHRRFWLQDIRDTRSGRCGLIPQVALVRHSLGPHTIPLNRSVYLINLDAEKHESIAVEQNM